MKAESLDGSEKQFFEFLQEYRALIESRIPGNFVFEYGFLPYMIPVHRHLEALVRDLPRGARVLDLGCGRGHFAAYLSLRGLKVQGLEVRTPRPQDDLFYHQDPRSIRRYGRLWGDAKKRYGAACAYFNGRDLPFRPATFDAVLFYASFEHVPTADIGRIAAEAQRVLKPGGRAYIFRCPTDLAWTEKLARWVGMGHHEKLYAKAEILGILRAAGFEITRCRRADFFPSHLLPLQGALNRFAHALLALEALLRWTPLAWLFHHFEIVARKKEGVR